ncbi:MAG: 4Fe-4S dicluster domain-containing protein, partial [Acidobacteria bacterium]|nr:4Fe-4S dicluster domain-containing protein [Acidobacteriota bacterium]
MSTAAATREIYWNIAHVWVMYLLLVPTLGVAGHGVWRHVQRWRKGQPAARFDRPAERIRRVLAHAVAQKRTARERYVGVFHRFLTYGFVVLTIATIVVALDADLGTSIMRGGFYLWFQSFTVDLFGALVLIAIAMAAVRRYIKRPRKLVRTSPDVTAFSEAGEDANPRDGLANKRGGPGPLVHTDEAALILVAIFIIAFTGFLLEGWRIAGTNDPWRAWSPFGNLVARASVAAMGIDAIRVAHKATWWLHLAVSFAFFAWIPYTKLMHILTAPLNIYTASLQPIGATLKAVDFEQEQFGVSELRQFTWKDLLDFDSCTECGRCTAVCPAHAVGKALSPRDIILQLRDLPENGGSTRVVAATPATMPDRLWECTTCAACVEACPVFIEQMPKIVDMRRHLVMDEAEYPDTMQDAVLSLEKRGHPF